jgi:hypothetical protein
LKSTSKIEPITKLPFNSTLSGIPWIAPSDKKRNADESFKHNIKNKK